MTTRLLAAWLTVLLHAGVGLAQQPAVAHRPQQEQPLCCGAVPVASEKSSDRRQPNQRTARVAPRLKPGAIKQLRLPDVHITSAAHYGVRRNGIKVPHVQVNGMIGGTIGFELLLPDKWNSRFVMGGGGGFVGRISNQARNTINQGYATVGTDTGHQWPSGLKIRWALDNVEAQVNYGYLAIHRTAQVAKSLIHAYYGSDPKYSYFTGCSTGGGQALIEAQRYPEDFDGIISAAPVVNHTGLAAARLYNAMHFFPDPTKLDKPIITAQVLQRLHAEVLKKCDEQDGVKDDILDDPRLCRFDLSQFKGITDVQRKALQAVYDGPRNETGQIFPGMPLGTEDRWFTWKAGSIPQILKREDVPNAGFAMGVDFCKYLLFNDPDWDYSKYDFSNWQKDSRLAGTFLNANNPDLSKFKAAGGKLILWHGWNDGPLTTLGSIDYFEEVEKRDPQVRDYFRLYLLPGVTHCRGGAGPDQVDWLTILTRWVEQGQPPQQLVARKLDQRGKATMTRPLHPYPLRAVYKGSGSTNEAQNFVLPK